jgi:Family of unknown function (DUF5984)
MQTKEFKIQFALDELADVTPWGMGDEASLHWFGLTQGRYWIETPEGDVLRYTPEIQAHWKSPIEVVDYQVARLFEDFLNCMPSVLEPVPLDIAQECSGRQWQERLLSWIEEETPSDQPRSEFSPDRWDLYHAAMDWWHARTFDTGYLRCGPLITIWRVGDTVHLRWTSGDNRVDGIAVFATPNGDISLSFDAFERTTTDFFEGVIAAMAERVQALQNGAQVRQPCQLDIAALCVEHAQRKAELRSSLLPVQTNWREVRTHLDLLSAALDAS